MSRSKKAAQAATAPAPHQNRTWFVSPEGGLRTGWLLAISLIGYAIAALAVRRGLTALFAALFRAWGIDAESAARAPRWAAAVYRWHGSAVTVIVCGALLMLSAVLRRLWLGRTGRAVFNGKALATAALTGLCAALAVAALCLIPDSMRLQWPLAAPRVTWALPALCAVSLLAALAEEAFLKRVLFDGLRERWGAIWAAGITCALFFVSNGGYAGNVACGINVLLLGGVCCALYARRGLWAAAGFRWGWSVGTVFLMGFGGAEAAVYRLYGVSEAWLTGGDAGPVYGLWATLLLAGILFWTLWKMKKKKTI